MKLDTVHDAFALRLARLRSAETQLIDALPHLTAAASDPRLRSRSPVTGGDATHGSRRDAVTGVVELDVLDEACSEMRGGDLRCRCDRVVRGAGRSAGRHADWGRPADRALRDRSYASALASDLLLLDAEQSCGKTLDEEQGIYAPLIRLVDMTTSSATFDAADA